jgi:undecaprenyl-diphosphatase
MQPIAGTGPGGSPATSRSSQELRRATIHHARKPGTLTREAAITRSVAAAGAIGIGLAVAFVWLGLVVRSGPTPFDTAVVAAVDSVAIGWVRSVLDTFSYVGMPIIWDTAVVGVAVVIAYRGRRRDAVGLVGWLLVAEIAAEVAKIVFDRTRPGGVAVSDLVTQASYPSGHVARTVVALGLLALLATTRPRARALAVAVAVVLSLVMGAARVSAGEHWPTDVIGGFLLSGVVLAAAAVTAQVSARRRRAREPSV